VSCCACFDAETYFRCARKCFASAFLQHSHHYAVPASNTCRLAGSSVNCCCNDAPCTVAYSTVVNVLQALHTLMGGGVDRSVGLMVCGTTSCCEGSDVLSWAILPASRVTTAAPQCYTCSYEAAKACASHHGTDITGIEQPTERGFIVNRVTKQGTLHAHEDERSGYLRRSHPVPGIALASSITKFLQVASRAQLPRAGQWPTLANNYENCSTM
jgi:hypothetical protein